ncbi:hypothetical protein H4582DRAFT_1986357, partial [Lactarius indigo]
MYARAQRTRIGAVYLTFWVCICSPVDVSFVCFRPPGATFCTLPNCIHDSESNTRTWESPARTSRIESVRLLRLLQLEASP